MLVVNMQLIQGVILLVRLLFYFTFAFASLFAVEAQKEEVNIGIYAFRPKAEMLKAFQPLADRLSKDIPSHHFNIIPLSIDEINKAIREERLNFVITNPGNYLAIGESHPVSDLARLVRKTKDGQPVYVTGGVIIARADRIDINTAQDLKDKKIVAVSEQAVSAYLSQAEVLFDKGVEIRKTAKVTFEDVVQDNLVLSVKKGTYDAAFVRAGVLEEMEAEGIAKMTDFKVINHKSIDGFPYMVSTPLYPEWVFAAINSDRELSRKVVISLLSIKDSDVESVVGGYYGWDTAPSYERTKNMMKKLKVYPFDEDAKFDIEDVFRKYFWENIIVLTVFLFIMAFAIKYKRLSTNLKAQKKLAQTYLDIIGVSVVIIDTKGVIDLVNPAGCTLLGCCEDNLLGENFFDNFLPEESRKFYVYIFECLNAKDNKPLEPYECIITRRDGEKRLVSWYITVLKDADGKVTAIVASGDDVTERRKTEEMLKQSYDENIIMAEYEHAFNQNSIVSKTDPNGIITYVNDNFCNVSGYAKEELIGHTHSVVRHPDTKDSVFEEMWDSITQKQIWQGRLKNRSKDGSTYIVNALIMPVVNSSGEIKEYISVREDVTKLVELGRKLEEERLAHLEKEMVAKSATEIARAKDAFLVVFTHELKTPLNAIINFSNYIAGAIAQTALKDKDELVDLAKRVQANGEAMLATVLNILDIARLRAQKLSFKNEEVDVGAIVEEVIRLNDAIAKEKSVVVTTNIEPDIKIISDAQRVSQIVSNLYSNALKYGKGKVLVMLKKVGEEFELSIEDNGDGIADKEKAFELFGSAQNDLASSQGGTGIGLNFSRDLCEGLEIKLTLEDSKTLGGAKFSLSKQII